MIHNLTRLALLFAGALALLGPVRADTLPERRILTVSATGTERIEATVADVRLAIEERGLTDEEARERMAERSNRILGFLREQAVDRLRTTALRLHPIYDYTQGDREIVGYQAMSVIEFRGNASEVGLIIDEAIARGANQVQDLTFTAPEETIEQARRVALRTATNLALQRADAVLETLGLRRERIIRIQIEPANRNGPVYPVRAMQARAYGAESASTDLEADEPEIQATVTLEVGY